MEAMAAGMACLGSRILHASSSKHRQHMQHRSQQSITKAMAVAPSTGIVEAPRSPKAAAARFHTLCDGRQPVLVSLRRCCCFQGLNVEVPGGDALAILLLAGQDVLVVLLLGAAGLQKGGAWGGVGSEGPRLISVVM